MKSVVHIFIHIRWWCLVHCFISGRFRYYCYNFTLVHIKKRNKEKRALTTSWLINIKYYGHLLYEHTSLLYPIIIMFLPYQFSLCLRQHEMTLCHVYLQIPRLMSQQTHLRQRIMRCCHQKPPRILFYWHKMFEKLTNEMIGHSSMSHLQIVPVSAI